MEKNCLNCGSKFITYPCKIKKGKGKYCSISCAFKHMQKNGGFSLQTGTYKSRGYVYAKARNHPHSSNGGYVPQHRLNMEKKLGRYLSPDEVVHHINGIKSDNRIENLMLVENNAEHMKLHSGENPKVLVMLNWEEMCFIKNLFFDDEETVIQFHPKKSKYIDNCANCLHLWKRVGIDQELPPSILVGLKPKPPKPSKGEDE